MTQAEFGKALGWAPSTISKWESGRGEPSRLSLKIILAFAEERGIRYRRRAKEVGGLPALCPSTPAPASSDRAVPIVTKPEIVSGMPDHRPSSRHHEARRGFQAQIHIRIGLGREAKPPGNRQPHHRIGNALAAMLVVGVLAGIGMPAFWGGKLTEPQNPSQFISPSRSSLDSDPGQVARLETAPEHPLAESASANGQSFGSSPSIEAAAPAVTSAGHLTGVFVGAGSRLATFKSAARSSSVAEGSWLGEWYVNRVEPDGVEVIDAKGATSLVRVGQEPSSTHPIE